MVAEHSLVLLWITLLRYGLISVIIFIVGVHNFHIFILDATRIVINFDTCVENLLVAAINLRLILFLVLGFCLGPLLIISWSDLSIIFIVIIDRVFLNQLLLSALFIAFAHDCLLRVKVKYF